MLLTRGVRRTALEGTQEHASPCQSYSTYYSSQRLVENLHSQNAKPRPLRPGDTTYCRARLSLPGSPAAARVLRMAPAARPLRYSCLAAQRLAASHAAGRSLCTRPIALQGAPRAAHAVRACAQTLDRNSCRTMVRFCVNLSRFLGSRLRCTSCRGGDNKQGPRVWVRGPWVGTQEGLHRGPKSAVGKASTLQTSWRGRACPPSRCGVRPQAGGKCSSCDSSRATRLHQLIQAGGQVLLPVGRLAGDDLLPAASTGRGRAGGGVGHSGWMEWGGAFRVDGVGWGVDRVVGGAGDGRVRVGNGLLLSLSSNHVVPGKGTADMDKPASQHRMPVLLGRLASLKATAIHCQTSPDPVQLVCRRATESAG